LGILAFSGYLYSYLFPGLLFYESKIYFFFNASNPTIKNGGLLWYQKKQFIIWFRKILSDHGAYKEGGIRKLRPLSNKLSFSTLFCKTDIGLRGSGINTVQELEQYAIRANFDFLVQDLIPFQNEVGIFYVRYQMKKRKNNRYCF
jgi:hypothetical protein